MRSYVLLSRHLSRRKLLFCCGRCTNCYASKDRRSLTASSSAEFTIFSGLNSLLYFSSLSWVTFLINSAPCSSVSVMKTMRCAADAY